MPKVPVFVVVVWKFQSQPPMKPRPYRALPAATGIVLIHLFQPLRAQVQCWAPGMDAPVTLTEHSRSANVFLGKPFRYDVFGIAGKLELGNRANNAELSGGVFKQKILGGLLGLGGTVHSTAYVYLQTGPANIYPQQLSITHSSPGAGIGPVHAYGQNWTLSDPIVPKNVNLGFHMAGSTLLGALLPGLISPPHYNLNPKGHFYVLGEYHAAPPVMTGTIDISADQVIVGSSVDLIYGINRFDTPIHRPPFLGLDLADIGLTVLGTPPPPETNGPISNALAPITTGVSLDLEVTVNLAAGQGHGWLKITKTP